MYPLKLRMKLSSNPWSRSSGSTQTLKIKSLVEDECAQNLCLCFFFKGGSAYDQLGCLAMGMAMGMAMEGRCDIGEGHGGKHA